MASLDKLSPSDPRVEHHTITIRGNTYHYLLGNPLSTPTGTILLVHGWPDISFGWRYQVPFLLSLNLRVIVPDLLGYGRTDAPEAVAEYSLKNISDDLAALAAHVAGPGEQIILGGHDWGGAVVWRFALWHPELVRAVFSVCTPYSPPRAAYIAPVDLIKILPNFKYQLQLAGPEVEAYVVGKERLRQFLSSLYGGRGSNREVAFTTADGVIFEILDKIGPTPLMSEEEVDFYVSEYERHGMHGPLNWYRTAEFNFSEELPLAEAGDAKTRIKVPSLMVTASRDSALPPSMSANMDKFFDNLEKREVNASHWALVEAPVDVNSHIAEFLTKCDCE
ncbi:Alpha/Beta hydrolase protein [Lasiosphaeris hirsuta]|uniref:Alpha/Beta hydrolase protein n=1 Tax=Lasiosphaeris hirsuta TaxID=260670 RepID=A0AA40A8I2_9PEZI|nr:Alpha/Beta hydrolase protein [Lasiosphaeris hirsuta]